MPGAVRAEFMQQTTHASKHNQAGPTADAGPYDYAPPVVSSGVGRPAPVKRPAWKSWGLSWRAALAILFANIAARALNDLGGWPLLHCYTLTYCIATVFTYWDTPQPRQGFLRWTLKVIGVFLNFFVAMVTVPQSLRGLLPDSLTFALPAFAFVLIFYWVPPLVPKNGRTSPLWQWLLCAAGFAAFWAWVGPTVVK